MNYKTNKEAVYLLLMVALSYPVLSVCPENILFYSPIGNVYLGNDTILKLVNNDIKCADEGDCWDGYNKAKLILPQDHFTNDKLIKNLDEWEWDGGSWILKSNSTGSYTFEVILENDASSCSEFLNLNVTSPKVENSSVEFIFSLTMVLFIALLAILLLLFLALRKKKSTRR